MAEVRKQGSHGLVRVLLFYFDSDFFSTRKYGKVSHEHFIDFLKILSIIPNIRFFVWACPKP